MTNQIVTVCVVGDIHRCRYSGCRNRTHCWRGLCIADYNWHHSKVNIIVHEDIAIE